MALYTSKDPWFIARILVLISAKYELVVFLVVVVSDFKGRSVFALPFIFHIFYTLRKILFAQDPVSLDS
jgi:hypothetical protein